MQPLRTIDHLIRDEDIKGKTVLLRADLNVPVYKGKVADNTRILRVIPTIQALLKKKAKVVVLSHFGRPEGEFVADMSLAPIVDTLSEALDGLNVGFGVDCIGNSARSAVEHCPEGGVVLLENLRFYKEEKSNDDIFAQKLASLGDYYVNDAFSCSHRAHASIVGIPAHLSAYAGYQLQEEVEQLGHILDEPERPIAAVVGGAKISTKLEFLESLVGRMNMLVIGGGMANTFLHAQGHEVGASLCEKELKNMALKILKKAESFGCKIFLPVDVVVAKELEEKVSCQVVPVNKVPKDHMILDIGPKTVTELGNVFEDYRTVVWNGPLGAYEYTPFDVGTVSLTRIIAGLTHEGKMTSVAGGGDIISALLCAGLRDSFTYISTAGGAFLEWLEGKELPGIAVLYSNEKRKGNVA